MTEPVRSDHPASRGSQVVHRWDPAAPPTHVVVLAHGINEHARRYDHVADALVANGAVVYAPDHYGHGLSDGPRALVDDIEAIVGDVGDVARRAAEAHPGLPLVLVGHSLGGLIATRFAQRHEAPLAGLVLSAPVIGQYPNFVALNGMDPLPDVPIDPSALSRDPTVGEKYMSDPLTYNGPIQKGALTGLFASIEKVEAGPAFDVPTLWLQGELDPLATLDVTRAALEALKPAEFEAHVYPGALHEVFNETNADEVVGDLVAFVARVVAAAPAGR